MLAIDVGTSGVKAAIVDGTGRVSALHRILYPTLATAGGGFTQEPEDWWVSLLKCARETLQGADAQGVLALILSSQIGTHLLVTEDGVPLTPAVTWQDGRSMHDQLAIEREYSRQRIASLVGINLPSAASWPLARLRWFEREYPRAYRRARYLFQPKEFLLYRLTGSVVGDSSSWRGLVNPVTSSAITVLEGLGMADLTVPIKQPTEVAGELRRDVADLLGVTRGLEVFVGWNDLNSSLLGSGAIAAGQAFDLGGTSEHVGVVLGESSANSFQAANDQQVVMNGPYGMNDGLPRGVRYGVSSNGGSVVEWCRAVAGTQNIEAMAAQAPPGSNGLIFLPYIVGERAPVWDPEARGAFVGLTLHSGLSDFLRAALEGVAFNLRQIMGLVGPDLIDSQSPVLTTGGPAQMDLWNRIKADVFGRPLSVPQQPEVGILGAAMIAAVGLGWHESLPVAARAMSADVNSVEPDPGRSARYSELYEQYVRLYPAIRSIAPE